MGLFVLFVFAGSIVVAIGTCVLIYHMRHPYRKTFAVALARSQPTDPADLDLDAEERTFKFDDGAQSPGWIIKGNTRLCHGANDKPVPPRNDLLVLKWTGAAETSIQHVEHCVNERSLFWGCFMWADVCTSLAAGIYYLSLLHTRKDRVVGIYTLKHIHGQTLLFFSYVIVVVKCGTQLERDFEWLAEQFLAEIHLCPNKVKTTVRERWAGKSCATINKAMSRERKITICLRYVV